MILESHVAIMLLKTQPETIVDFLLKNEEFVSLAELGGYSYPHVGTFKHAEVSAALQAANEKAVTLQNTDGIEFLLERLDKGVRITKSDDKKISKFISEFDFLDPEPSNRLKAFDDIVIECLPLMPSEDYWRATLTARSLSEEEVTQLISDIRNSPSQVHSQISRKLDAGKLNTDDIFPKSLSYYEALVGPCPREQNSKDYIDNTLIPHQEKLISKSINNGLSYVLSTNIDLSLSPSIRVKDILPKNLISPLESIKFTNNPFALLGGLEIALSKISEHENFHKVAADAIERIITIHLCGDDESNYYNIVLPLIHSSLRWMSVENDFCETPPYWRRLAAFTHAHYVYDILSKRSIDVELFITWCQSIRTSGTDTAEILDIHKEPLWQTDALSQFKLQAEIVGRLKMIKNSEKYSEIDIPNWTDINDKIEKFENMGGLPFVFCPGPMQGDQRHYQKEIDEVSDSKSMAESFDIIISNLRKDPLGLSWKNLYFSSQLFRFDKTLLDNIIQLVDQISLLDVGENKNEYFEALACAANIAAMQPCEILGKAAVVSLLAKANDFNDEIKAQSGYFIILVASAAFVDKEKRMKFMEQNLLNYAHSLPKGCASKQLFISLEILKKFYPIKEWCFGKARMVSSSVLS